MITTLAGTNLFAINEKLAITKSSYIDKYGDLAYEKLEGDEASADQLIAAITSPPFLVPQKLVVLKKPSAQKSFVEGIEQAIKLVPDNVEVIIVEPKIDKRSVYYKMLKSKTDYSELDELDPAKLSNWIVQYVKKHGGQIAQADARYLIDRTGTDQQLLASELEKLILHKPIIDKLAIETLVEPGLKGTIFELLDAVFAGDYKKLSKLYYSQRAQKVEPQQIIAMLAWQLHVLAIIKVAGDKTSGQIASEAKISPYVVSKSAAIAKNLTLIDVKRLVSKALKLDIKLKTQNVDADEAILAYLFAIS